jgi:hypothetical protein
MSDSFAIVAFSDLSGADAVVALKEAEIVLRKYDLVAGEHDPTAILGQAPRVLRPSRGAVRYNAYLEHTLGLRTNGVAFRGPGYFNIWALGSPDWFECPACDGRIGQDDKAFGDLLNDLGTNGVAFANGEPTRPVTCPHCGIGSDVRKWRLDDPVLVADAAIEFWSWPGLERNATPASKAEGLTLWALDLPAILEDVVGRPATLSWVRI